MGDWGSSPRITAPSGARPRGSLPCSPLPSGRGGSPSPLPAAEGRCLGSHTHTRGSGQPCSPIPLRRRVPLRHRAWGCSDARPPPHDGSRQEKRPPLLPGQPDKPAAPSPGLCPTKHQSLKGVKTNRGGSPQAPSLRPSLPPPRQEQRFPHLA